MQAIFTGLQQTGPLWGVIVFIQVILIILSILLGFGFVYSFMKAWEIKPKMDISRPQGKRPPGMRDAVIKDRWQSVIKRFSLGTPESARLAVIEADALIDTTLKNIIELPGEHLADRLSNLETEDLTTLPRVWRAHRMRNELVHTPGFTLSVQDAKGILEDYEAFLKELEIL